MSGKCRLLCRDDVASKDCKCFGGGLANGVDQHGFHRGGLSEVDAAASFQPAARAASTILFDTDRGGIAPTR